jgi:hypothetical protein
MKQELYVTESEQEAYDLAREINLPPVKARSHVEDKVDKFGKAYYVVYVDAPEAYDRAKKVRVRMFGS